MWFPSWLRDRKRRGSPCPRPTFRPTLEALEGRCLPSTLTVTNNLDSGPGSLRAEIAAAHNKDTIAFAPNLDGQTIGLTSGELYINKSVTIQGPGASQLTISGNHASRVFEVGSVTATIAGLTISNGYASTGGAIVNSGTLTIRNSTLSGNTASDAAGAIDNYGKLTISGCTLSGNAARDAAGAIRNYVGILTISNSTLSGNTTPLSSGTGGAIFNVGRGTLTLSGCTLSGNTALDGGAVYNQGSMTVSGCTLSNNSAGDEGGAIFNDFWDGGVLTVSDSVFSGNTPDNIFGYYTDGGGNSFR